MCLQIVHFYVVGAIHYYLFSHSLLIIGFVTRVKRRIPLMRWELFILRSSIPGFSGIRVAQSLVFCVIFFFFFVDHSLSFFFGPLYCLSNFDLPLEKKLFDSVKLFLYHVFGQNNTYLFY
jgi:hypothetical protein